jgi:protein TonB
MPAPSPPTVRHEFVVSKLLQGNLTRKVEPKYPPLAMSARIQGPVVLAAVISKAGTIENLKLVSGHPLLVPAAIDAVRQWLYRPYVLNGEVIEVETQITVNFTLSQ